MSVAKCEYACSRNAYSEAFYEIRDDAAEVQNTDFSLKGGGSGCRLKAFNDGEQLPKEKNKTGSRVDITCVGPENPLCPKNQGFRLVPIVIDGIETEVARRE